MVRATRRTAWLPLACTALVIAAFLGLTGSARPATLFTLAGNGPWAPRTGAFATDAWDAGGFAAAPDGSVVVTLGGRLWSVRSDGRLRLITARSAPDPFDSLAVGRGGAIFAISPGEDVYRISSSARTRIAGAAGCDDAAKFRLRGLGGPALSTCMWPVAVAVLPDGRVLVAASEDRIVAFRPGGSTSAFAGTEGSGYGGDGGPAASAQLRSPGPIATAADGTVLFIDQNETVVRRISPSGTITTVAGGGTKRMASTPLAARLLSLHFLRDVVSDESGGLFVADADGGVLHVGGNGIARRVIRGPSAGAGSRRDSLSALLHGDGAHQIGSQLDAISSLAVSHGDLLGQTTEGGVRLIALSPHPDHTAITATRLDLSPTTLRVRYHATRTGRVVVSLRRGRDVHTAAAASQLVGTAAIGVGGLHGGWMLRLSLSADAGGATQSFGIVLGGTLTGPLARKALTAPRNPSRLAAPVRVVDPILARTADELYPPQEIWSAAHCQRLTHRRVDCISPGRNVRSASLRSDGLVQIRYYKGTIRVKPRKASAWELADLVPRRP